MRLGRIASPDGVAFVSIEGDSADAVAQRSPNIRSANQLSPAGVALADVRLLAPILASKVVYMGKNYTEHIIEMGGEAPEDPVIFLKPNTAIIGPNVAIQLPEHASPYITRARLAAVIGRPCKDVSAASGREHLGLRSPTMCRRATSRRPTGNGCGLKVTTLSALSAHGSSRTWIRRIWRSVPRSMGASGS